MHSLAENCTSDSILTPVSWDHASTTRHEKSRSPELDEWCKAINHLGWITCHGTLTRLVDESPHEVQLVQLKGLELPNESSRARTERRRQIRGLVTEIELSLGHHRPGIFKCLIGVRHAF